MQSILTNDQFNTITLQISFNQIINKEDITKRVLLPAVLYAGSEKYLNQTLINKRLDELYGANIYVGASKIGNLMRMTFSVKFIDPKVINDDKYTLKDIYDVLKEVILNPKVKNEAFDKNLVNNEKKSLMLDIIRQKENHAWYSVKSGIEELYNDSIHSIDSDGYIEDLDDIDEKVLYEYYKKCLLEDEIKVFATGNVTKEELEFIDITNDIQLKKEVNIKQLASSHSKEIIKSEKVNQAVLILFYDIKTYQGDKDITQVHVLNHILGGSPSSLLFTQVREKHGLCYSINSNFLINNGLILINMGINQKDYDIAKALVEEQVNLLKNTLLDDTLIKDTIKSIKNKYLEGLDSQSTYLKKIINKELFNMSKTKEEFFKSLENITSNDIKSIATKLELKLSYFLRGETNEIN